MKRAKILSLVFIALECLATIAYVTLLILKLADYKIYGTSLLFIRVYTVYLALKFATIADTVASIVGRVVFWLAIVLYTAYIGSRYTNLSILKSAYYTVRMAKNAPHIFTGIQKAG